MTEMNETDNAAGENIGRRGLLDLRRVWRHRWLVAGCTLLSLTAGVVYLLFVTPTYQAKARVLVQQDGLSFNRPDRSPLDREFLATQAEIIRSPLTVARALKTVQVTMPPNEKRDRMTYVLDSLKVVPKVDTDVLSIEYRSSVEGEAPKVIQAIIDSYRQIVQETARGDFTDSIAVLQRAEDLVRQELKSLQNRYLLMRKSGPMIGRGRNVADVDTARIQELSKRLGDARIRRIALAVRQKQVVVLVRKSIVNTSVSTQNGNGDTATQVENALMLLLREEKIEAVNDLIVVQQQVTLARTRLREVSRTYGPRHPDFRTAESQLAAWQEISRSRIAALGDVLKQELRIAQAAEDELERLYKVERSEVKKMDSLLTEEQILLSNISRVERLHDGALERLAEFSLADEALKKGRATVNVRIVEAPTLTEMLVWPVKIPILAACLILGLVTGVLIASTRPPQPEPHSAE